MAVLYVEAGDDVDRPDGSEQDVCPEEPPAIRDGVAVEELGHGDDLALEGGHGPLQAVLPQFAHEVMVAGEFGFGFSGEVGFEAEPFQAAGVVAMLVADVDDLEGVGVEAQFMEAELGIGPAVDEEPPWGLALGLRGDDEVALVDGLVGEESSGPCEREADM